MKTKLHRFAAAVAVFSAALLPATRAADDEKTPAPREEKRTLRVITPSATREHRVLVPSGEKQSKEMETVAFLGVETSTVSAALTAQLGLPRGNGLVVNHVVPKSAAAEVLKPNDILLKFDDQILIEVRQLSVLVRNHQEGDEITLTYLRGGQKATAKVKLGKQDVPKFTWSMDGLHNSIMQAFGGEKFESMTPEATRAHVDKLLSMIQRTPNGDPERIQIDRESSPGFRAMTVHTGNSNLVFSDEEGSLELTIKEGAKSLVAKDTKGAQVFAGPVNTPEERKALPAAVRERLEKVEAMHDVTFHTDGDFKGAETRVIRPRGISFPVPRRIAPPQSALFF